MGGIYKPVTANNVYLKSKRDITNAKSDVDQLKEVSKHWTNGAIIVAINEELHNAESLEKRVELLQFKTDILEHSIFGDVNNFHED